MTSGQSSIASSYDVVIIGAGAAGLMAALTAGKRGRRVLVLDHAKAVGEKIRISGGGRCNFTNLHCGAGNFISGNPRFCLSALKRFHPRDFIAMVEAHGIAYHEKTLGQLFCDGSAREIIAMLLAECEAGGVEIHTETEVRSVEKADGGFRVATNNGSFSCASLVIATGGLSVPKMGATGFGHDIARQFGLAVVPPRPGLVPFTFEGGLLDKLRYLAGVSADVEVRCGKTRFTEALLFTHRGLSGPAILQISSYWREGDEVIIDLLPGVESFLMLKEGRSNTPKQTVKTLLAASLPKRLAQFVAEEAGVGGRLADLSDKKLRLLAAQINQWRVAPSGTEGFRTAEVTLGGVDTNALSSQTFEAREVPGLYFIGEVVDVTGHLGGHNFQWAWASGFAAGHYI
jgi:hypothetical protein